MPLIYFKGRRNNKKIALTFDDGPSKETEEILEILKKNESKATFFILGKRIAGREKTIKRIIKEGHQIGNHSYSHKKLGFKSKKIIELDLRRCDKELEKLGIKTNLFRPPKFSIGPSLILVCNKLKKKIIMCDVVSGDWKKLGKENVINKILKKTRGGSIINLHDYLEGIGSNKEIVGVVKEIIPKLKKKYEIVTISNLLEI
jgi:peptidoglycan/xylan/chitin deacetylase (PgdA/CDA1 family)